MELSRDLLAIGERLRTQDNRATDHPMFSAQEKRREYGYDGDYASDYIWVAYDDAGELSEVAAGTQGARQVYYKEVWHTVMIAFTEKACEDYLRQNRHHFGETRIYGHTLYRNHEMIAIRAWLMSAEPPEPILTDEEIERGIAWHIADQKIIEAAKAMEAWASKQEGAPTLAQDVTLDRMTELAGHLQAVYDAVRSARVGADSKAGAETSENGRT